MAALGFKLEPSFNPRLYEPALAGGALFDVGIYPALWISMILGTPSKARRLRHLLRRGLPQLVPRHEGHRRE